MQITIVNRKLRREAALGLAWFDPDYSLIELDPRMTPRRRLTILIHEAMHIAFPDMAESVVDRKAAMIAKLVHQDGYRRDPDLSIF